MIIGEFTTGVRILLEKGPSRIFLRTSNYRKIPRNSYFNGRRK
jgi:hypothetical protein